jgi:hypothetical protein
LVDVCEEWLAVCAVVALVKLLMRYPLPLKARLVFGTQYLRTCS